MLVITTCTIQNNTVQARIIFLYQFKTTGTCWYIPHAQFKTTWYMQESFFFTNSKQLVLAGFTTCQTWATFPVVNTHFCHCKVNIRHLGFVVVIKFCRQYLRRRATQHVHHFVVNNPLSVAHMKMLRISRQLRIHIKVLHSNKDYIFLCSIFNGHLFQFRGMLLPQLCIPRVAMHLLRVKLFHGR
jgi:hypothetical protein